MAGLDKSDLLLSLEAVSLDRLCIHQVSVMQCGFQESIEIFARHGITKTALWKEKVDEVGTEQARVILDDHGVEAISLCAGGFLSEIDIAKRKAAMDENQRMLDMAAALGAKSMVTITGGLPDASTDLDQARQRSIEGLEPLLKLANAAGVQIALEPLHPMVCGFRSVISSLGEANDILDELGSPQGLGIALDSYALWWDANLCSEIKRAGNRIINFHVSDWLVKTTDVRLDRGMPGDGQINNQQIRQWLEASGFDGPVEVEIFSAENWWKKSPDDVVSTIRSTSAKYL